jgi:hypothetical protein
MAESDTILQLGIEAARDGNRDEARNLFTLLTRQEPDNMQAWLWLAGVADSVEERRAALTKVLELDPKNEMALKGLEAMKATPASQPVAPVASSTANDPVPVQRADLTEEERYAAELDAAYEDYDAVPSAPVERRVTADDIDDTMVAPTPVGAGRADRVRTTPRRSNVRVRDDYAQPQGIRFSNLAWILIGAAGVAALLFVTLWIFGQNSGTQTAGVPGANPTAGVSAGQPGAGTPGTNGAGTAGQPAQPGTDPNAQPQPTADPNAPPAPPSTDPNAQPQPTADPNAPPAPPSTDPNAQPAAPANYPDPVGANPAIIGPDTFVEANGVAYSFGGQSLCPVSCAAVVSPQIGSFTAQGNHVLVLVLVGNNTETTQPIAPDFFVLKDEQGRVYTAQPQLSSAYVQTYGGADRSLEDAIPAGQQRTSMALVFDVAPDASGLTLFTRPKQDQGWRVLQ